MSCHFVFKFGTTRASFPTNFVKFYVFTCSSGFPCPPESFNVILVKRGQSLFYQTPQSAPQTAPSMKERISSLPTIKNTIKKSIYCKDIPLQGDSLLNLCLLYVLRKPYLHKRFGGNPHAGLHLKYALQLREFPRI